MLSEQDIKDTDFGQTTRSEGTPSLTSTPRSSLPVVGSCDSLADLARPGTFNLSASDTGYVLDAVPLRVPGEFAQYGLSYAGLSVRDNGRVADDAIDLDLEDKARPVSRKKEEFASQLAPLPLVSPIATIFSISPYKCYITLELT